MDLKKILIKMGRLPFKILTNEELIIVLIILYGIIGSYLIMNLNLIDSIYYAFVTMATIGYGDITAITIPQKIFTITLAIGGLGIIAYILTIILNNVSQKVNKVAKGAKIMNKIDKMENYVVVCGYGRVGKSVVKNLNERGQNVIIIEKDEILTEKVKDKKNIAIIKRDATDKEVLEYVLNSKCDSVILTVGDDVTNVFIVLSIREMDKDVLIVSRLSNTDNKNKLIQAGADKLISPEIRGGEEIFYTAIQDQMVKITFKNKMDTLIEESVLIEKSNCRLESIDFHLAGISTPLSRKIEQNNFENIRDIIGKRIENPEFKQLYEISGQVHSLWVSAPNKKTQEELINLFEDKENVIGINLTNTEIINKIKKE